MPQRIFAYLLALGCSILVACGGESDPTSSRNVPAHSSTASSTTVNAPQAESPALSESGTPSSVAKATTTLAAFSATVGVLPGDGASVSGVVQLEVRGSEMVNVELLPANSYTPRLGVFTISGNGTVARLDFDTTKLPDGPVQVRISAFDKPAGEPGAREIIAMPARTWNISNGAAPAFSATAANAPADGATINGTVTLEVRGSGMANVELLPATGYTPRLGVFTVSNNGTVARFDFDTKALPDGPVKVRIGAFNTLAGDPSAREIVAMSPRTWNISNGAAPAFSATFANAPADGATINGTVMLEVRGSGMANVELLPATGYTPRLGVFTIVENGTLARLYFDPKVLPNGPTQVRISAFNKPAGEPAATEIVAMPARTWNISNPASEQPGQFPNTMEPPTGLYVQPTEECTPLESGMGTRNCFKFAASVPHILPATYIGKTSTEPGAGSCYAKLSPAGMLELRELVGGEFRVWPVANAATGKMEWNTLTSTKQADGVQNLTEEYRATDNLRNVYGVLTWRAGAEAAGAYSATAASTNPLLKSFTCVNMQREQASRHHLPKSYRGDPSSTRAGWNLRYDTLDVPPEDKIRVITSGIDMFDGQNHRMIPMEIEVPVTGVSQTFRLRFDQDLAQRNLVSDFGLRTGAMVFRIDNKSSRMITAVRLRLEDNNPPSPQGSSSHPGYAHWHPNAPPMPTVSGPSFSFVGVSTDMKEVLVSGSHARLDADLIAPGQRLQMGGIQAFGIHQFEEQGQDRSFDLVIEPIFVGQQLPSLPPFGAPPPTTAPVDGATLYRENCQGCHSPLAETKKGQRSADAIRKAIATEPAMQTDKLKNLTPEQIQAIAAVLATRPVAMSTPILLAKKAQRGKLEPEIVPIEAASTMLVAHLFNVPDKARKQPVSTAGRMTVPGHKQRIEPVMPLCGSNVPPPSS